VGDLSWEFQVEWILKAQRAGQCWRCESVGNRLGPDPMGLATDRLHLNLCHSCQIERKELLDRRNSKRRGFRCD
jgi:hypothetical protein